MLYIVIIKKKSINPKYVLENIIIKEIITINQS